MGKLNVIFLVRILKTQFMIWIFWNPIDQINLSNFDHEDHAFILDRVCPSATGVLVKHHVTLEHQAFVDPLLFSSHPNLPLAYVIVWFIPQRQIYLPVMIKANSTLSYLATFQLNFDGDAFWAFLPFSDLKALSSPFCRKLTACTRFGFLEKVAFYV